MSANKTVSNNLGLFRPLQRVSFNEKKKDDYNWFKTNIDYYINKSYFYINNTISKNTSERDLKILYDVYNNKFPAEWFNWIKNPLNTTNENYKNFPARIRPYTIIRPNIDLLLGEFNKRNFNFIIENVGETGFNSFNESKLQKIQQNVKQLFINKLNELGVDTGIETKEVELPADIEAKFNTNYRDLISIIANNWFKGFKERAYIKDTWRDLFKDWLITGEIYTYKGIEHNELVYRRHSPIFIDYDKSISCKYLEDGEWCTALYELTFSEVLDMFYDEFKDKKQIANIESSTDNGLISYYNYYVNQEKELLRTKVHFVHVQWKGQEKKYKRTYIDQFTGQIFEDEVDELYKLNKELGDIKLEEFWVNKTHEGYRFHINGNYEYLKMQIIPVQRTELNNLSRCKLSYNGKKWSDTHSTNISLVELAIPYQVLFIIIQYRIELAIAKSKLFALLDKNTIPDKNGWDEEKFIYQAESTGIFYIDRSKIGVDKSFNQYQVIDLTMYQHITQLISIQEFVSSRCDEMFGITRQRKGQVMASDSVSGTDSSIYQSAVISDNTFTSFEEFLVREVQGLIDFSKFEHLNSKRSAITADDFSVLLYNIDAEDYINADLNVRAIESSKESRKLDIVKQIALQSAQDPNIKKSKLIEMIRADSISEIQQKLKEIELIEEKIAQATAQSERDFELELEQNKKDFILYENTLKEILIDKEWDRKDQNSYIEGEIKANIESIKLTEDTSGDLNNDGILDVNNILNNATKRADIINKQRKNETDALLKEREINLKEKVANDTLKLSKEKLKLEDKKIDTQLKIAKQNKNRYDK